MAIFLCVLLVSIVTPRILSDDEAVTFTTSESFVRVVGYEGSYNLNMSLHLRTWQEEGVLVFHKFSSRGYLKIFLNEGRMMAEVVSEGGGSPLTSLEHYDTLLNDGKWHILQFYIMQTQVGLSINNQTSTGSLPAQVRTGGSQTEDIYVNFYLLLCR